MSEDTVGVGKRRNMFDEQPKPTHVPYQRVTATLSTGSIENIEVSRLEVMSAIATTVMPHQLTW